MVRVPFFQNPYEDEDIKLVVDCLKSDWVTSLGPKTEEFEYAFSKYLGISHSIAVSSCTAGLDLALKALKGWYNVGDNVLLPSFTFHSDADVIVQNGAIPNFVDIDEYTFNIADDLEYRINDKSRGVILTHYAGQLADMEQICEICNQHNLFLIEDCAHILGGGAGTFGDINVFSFNSTKPLSTLQGGMVVTNYGKSADKIRLLRNHNISSALNREHNWQYDVEEPGYNYCITEMQAALGLSQLSKVEKNNWERITKATYLTELLHNIKGIITPISKFYHNYHLYTIRVTKDYPLTRDELYLHLKKNGIDTSIKYIPIHHFSYYKKYANNLPVTDKVAEEVLCLPIYANIEYRQLEYVAEVIKNV